MSSDLNKIYRYVPDSQKERLQTFRTQHPYKKMDVDGTPWHYLSCGQGHRAVLLLPGGFTRADIWFHVILALEGAYRILAPDAYPLQGIYKMDQVCTALLKMLERETVEQATVIGLSAGGGVAQFFVQEYPQNVAHLVLSHCGVIKTSAAIEQRTRGTLRMIKLLPFPIVRRMMLGRTSGSISPSSEWAAFERAYFREVATLVNKRMLEQFVREGMETRRDFAFQPEALQSWPGRVLLLSSEDDPLSVEHMKELESRYPRARTHIFKEGGHHTVTLFPEAYVAVLQAFLGEDEKQVK